MECAGEIVLDIENHRDASNYIYFLTDFKLFITILVSIFLWPIDVIYYVMICKDDAQTTSMSIDFFLKFSRILIFPGKAISADLTK